MLKERTLVIPPDALDSLITDYHWMVNAIKEMRAEMVIGAKTLSMESRLHYQKQ